MFTQKKYEELIKKIKVKIKNILTDEKLSEYEKKEEIEFLNFSEDGYILSINNPAYIYNEDGKIIKINHYIEFNSLSFPNEEARNLPAVGPKIHLAVKSVKGSLDVGWEKFIDLANNNKYGLSQFKVINDYDDTPEMYNHQPGKAITVYLNEYDKDYQNLILEQVINDPDRKREIEKFFENKKKDDLGKFLQELNKKFLEKSIEKEFHEEQDKDIEKEISKFIYFRDDSFPNLEGQYISARRLNILKKAKLKNTEKELNNFLLQEDDKLHSAIIQNKGQTSLSDYIKSMKLYNPSGKPDNLGLETLSLEQSENEIKSINENEKNSEESIPEEIILDREEEIKFENEGKIQENFPNKDIEREKDEFKEIKLEHKEEIYISEKKEPQKLTIHNVENEEYKLKNVQNDVVNHINVINIEEEKSKKNIINNEKEKSNCEKFFDCLCFCFKKQPNKVATEKTEQKSEHTNRNKPEF